MVERKERKGSGDREGSRGRTANDYCAITKDEEPCSRRGTANGRFPSRCNRQINVRFSNLISGKSSGRIRPGQAIRHGSIRFDPIRFDCIE